MGGGGPIELGVTVVEATAQLARMARCGAPGGARRLTLTTDDGDFVLLVCRAQDLCLWSPEAAAISERREK